MQKLIKRMERKKENIRSGRLREILSRGRKGIEKAWLLETGTILE